MRKSTLLGPCPPCSPQIEQDPCASTELRVARAMGEIGPSVLVGATTTLLGIVPMAFASNVVFRVFFKMFLIIIIFGVCTYMICA